MDLTYVEQFKDYIEFGGFIRYPQTVYKFPNGYGASVIERYRFEEACIEIAVIKFRKNGDWVIDYSTPITDGLIRVSNLEERDNVLQRIFDLKEEPHA
jgi:hypothetical protein